MTRNEAIDRLNEIFVVVATSTIRGLATEVELGPDDGMPRPSVLNADHTDVSTGAQSEPTRASGAPSSGISR